MQMHLYASAVVDPEGPQPTPPSFFDSLETFFPTSARQISPRPHDPFTIDFIVLDRGNPWLREQTSSPSSCYCSNRVSPVDADEHRDGRDASATPIAKGRGSSLAMPFSSL